MFMLCLLFLIVMLVSGYFAKKNLDELRDNPIGTDTGNVVDKAVACIGICLISLIFFILLI